jgi:putative CocE/NonD family hydrolase
VLGSLIVKHFLWILLKIFISKKVLIDFMTILSRMFGKMMKLPQAETHKIVVKRDLKVPMPDGVDLLADHYYPRGDSKPPTVLVRSPYGRRIFFGLMYGRFFAERGFQVLIQSCRGTFGSGGQFYPFFNEHDDGIATIEWIKKQDWFSGELVTNGPSYLGYVQWTVARDAGSLLKAIAPQVCNSDFAYMHYPGGSFSLHGALSWTAMIASMESSSLLRYMLINSDKKLVPALNHLPLQDAANLATGKSIPHWQDWLEHNNPEDEYWKKTDFKKTLAEMSIPVNMVGGWYDIFLPWQLRDYATLRKAGRQPFLTIGPWVHDDIGVMVAGVREAIPWFHAHLSGDRSELREEPVKLFIMGANEWRNFLDWPPSGSLLQRWHLQPNSGLNPEDSTESEPDHYRYDPSDPTPTVGGSLLGPNSGPKKNNDLESRSDVLVYTSDKLERDLEVIGPIQAELYVNSNLEYTDFFARLCDVNSSGKSINICDGILRLEPGKYKLESDGCIKIIINLWPTAYRFFRKHHIRLQVSSGAHPRFVRNFGTGDPLATATKLVVAEQTIYHDPSHPSAIILPVMN